jgi:hypothetical protein
MNIEIEHYNKDTQPGYSNYITDEERQHLIYELHSLFAWVGEPLPDTVDIDGKTIKIHDTIWWCIHKKEFTEEEKNNFKDITRLLEKKEKDYENKLHTANLTHEEAGKLYHEMASIARAIMDIKECETGKVNLKDNNEDVIQRIDDAKRWLGFLKTVGKK